MGTLDGRVAIVTGGGRGIGRGIALALAKEGAQVALADIDETTVEATAEELRQLGAEAFGARCDVRRSAQVDAFVARVVERFGGVDILVNNAMAAHVGVPLQDNTDEAIELALATGPAATLYFMRACYPHLTRSDGRGRVINLRSGSDVQGLDGYSAYIAAKAAVGGITRAAAREWGRANINVNSVAPFSMSEAAVGYFESRPDELEAALASLCIPRPGDAEDDIGRAVVYLAGPDAGYVTGATLPVDGGGSFFS
jgi:NAD(P)-dependent dehydrogenase (short-subunit alcohol dehydrogenase family)